ncbi:hypothetical protein L4C33_19725, partial [Vibrio makurazakiensis]|uniref:hypothetical protein n=1 Tax=Vibrio makurazakiensis TaxID=2910250 RepID=UPI003D0D4028
SFPLHTLYLCFFLFSSNLYAKEPWFLREVFNTHSVKPNAAYYVNDAGLFECGLDSVVLCSDEVSYYTTRLFMELHIENERVDKVVMALDFSAISYSQIQLNLRKDGFQLEEITIEGERFSVREALLNYDHKSLVGATAKIVPNGAALSQIDKELVEFINSRPSNARSMSVWRVANETSPVVMLEKDSEEIRLSLDRSN